MLKVVYLIGNGFDLNLGLKTAYSDFYDYYKGVESSSKLIADFKDRLLEVDPNNPSKYQWSDLELFLGEDIKNFGDENSLKYCLSDIHKSLTTYLKSIETQISYDEDYSKILLAEINAPYLHLTPKEQGEFQKKLNDFKINSYHSDNSWAIDIINFNYTKTLEIYIGDNQSINNNLWGENSKIKL